MDFAGIHIGGPQGFLPTQVKIDALLNLSPPSNLTELRHFIGCWNQMRDYLPDYTHSTTNLTSLLKKDVPFIWDGTMQAVCLYLLILKLRRNRSRNLKLET